MRVRIFILSLLILSGSGIYAGEIHLTDKTVVKGTNIEIVNDSVKYREAGKEENVTIKTGKVEKIVFDDGAVIKIAREKSVPAPAKGVIFLNSGENIPFESLVDKGDYVEYVPRGAAYHNFLKKEDIRDIKYGDLKEIFLDTVKRKSPEEKKREEFYRVNNNKIHEEGFHSSIIWFSLFGGVGSMKGDFDKYENELYDADKGNITNDNYYLDNYHDSSTWGIDLNLILYTRKMKQKRGFNLTGKSFGIMGRYQKVKVNQAILKYYDRDSNGYSEDNEWFTGKLMEYRSWQAGPVFDLIFSPRGNSFNLVGHSFIIGGVISGGELTAAPGLRETGVVYEKSQYSSGLKGYLDTLGTGVFFVLNQGFPAAVGLSFTYSHANLNLDRELPLYGNRKSLEIYSAGYEISCGIHF